MVKADQSGEFLLLVKKIEDNGSIETKMIFILSWIVNKGIRSLVWD